MVQYLWVRDLLALSIWVLCSCCIFVVVLQESDGAVPLGQGPAGSVHLGALFLLYFVVLFCRSQMVQYLWVRDLLALSILVHCSCCILCCCSEGVRWCSTPGLGTC